MTYYFGGGPEIYIRDNKTQRRSALKKIPLAIRIISDQGGYRNPPKPQQKEEKPSSGVYLS